MQLWHTEVMAWSAAARYRTWLCYRSSEVHSVCRHKLGSGGREAY